VTIIIISTKFTARVNNNILQMKRPDRLSALNRLLEAKKDIAYHLYQHQDCLKSLRKQSCTSSSSSTTSFLSSVDQEYPVDTILNYSSNISYAMYAPKQYFIGMKLLNYHPPAPQAEEMRDGLLQKYYLRLKRNKNDDFGSSISDQVSSEQKHSEQQTFVNELKNKLALRRTASNMFSTSAGTTDILRKGGGKQYAYNKMNTDSKVIPTNVQLAVDHPAAIEHDKIVGMKRSRAANLAFTYSDDEESSDDD